MKHLPVPHAEDAWDTHGRRAILLASIWTTFLIGALLGGATPRLAMWTLLPPILVLVALAALEHATRDEA